MIQGKTIDNQKIPLKMWHSFFLLNQSIEASLTGNKVNDTNNIINTIYNQISRIKKKNIIILFLQISLVILTDII